MEQEGDHILVGLLLQIFTSTKIIKRLFKDTGLLKPIYQVKKMYVVTQVTLVIH